ncbi:hypothetical Protein YC6258_01451 [Gynuella sunshinyii YC6258]|uniref:Uncharacterized protein n=1 Tax=Gynuella sunshinyii YC6258 TaxID=1445510 RepID=A0A0C5VT52_9GAMM|nr:hypothetical Protein YC6258_01451 [Gynuella sunshinyii YC6258]
MYWNGSLAAVTAYKPLAAQYSRNVNQRDMKNFQIDRAAPHPLPAQIHCRSIMVQH